jgi:hypothetical protein
MRGGTKTEIGLDYFKKKDHHLGLNDYFEIELKNKK